ncbi:hypothetical protein BGX38DRAFT_1197972, partial [Terfezia claveryi]
MVPDLRYPLPSLPNSLRRDHYHLLHTLLLTSLRRQMHKNPVSLGIGQQRHLPLCKDSLVHHPRWQHNMVPGQHHPLRPLLSNSLSRQKNQNPVSLGYSQQRHLSLCKDSLVHYPRWQHNMVPGQHHPLRPLLSNSLSRQKNQNPVSLGCSQLQRHYRGCQLVPTTVLRNKDHNTYTAQGNNRDSGSREKDNRDIIPRGTDKITETGKNLDIKDEMAIPGIKDETSTPSNATMIPATHT